MNAADPSVRVVLTARTPAQANAIVRNADGSVSLGTTAPAPAAAYNPASNPMERALRRMDETPMTGPVNLVGAPPGALFLPTGMRIR